MWIQADVTVSRGLDFCGERQTARPTLGSCGHKCICVAEGKIRQGIYKTSPATRQSWELVERGRGRWSFWKVSQRRAVLSLERQDHFRRFVAPTTL